MAKKIMMTVLFVISGLAIALMMGAKEPNCNFLNPDPSANCQLNYVNHVCCKLGNENVTFVNECFCTTDGGTILFFGDCK
jgi:hypothetical protein